MARHTPDAIIDQQLDQVVGDFSHACAGQPTNYTEAATTYQLASKAMTGGDFTKANGDVDGRKQTVPSVVDAYIDNNGLADHNAITKGTDLVDVTIITPSQALTAGGTVTIAAWDHEIGDAE